MPEPQSSQVALEWAWQAQTDLVGPYANVVNQLAMAGTQKSSRTLADAKPGRRCSGLVTAVSNRPAVSVSALFVRPVLLQRSSLAAELGCTLDEAGNLVQVSPRGKRRFRACMPPETWPARRRCRHINQTLSAEDRRQWKRTP